MRKPGWNEDTSARFIEALRRGDQVRQACAAVGLTPSSAYKHRRRDPAFSQAWDRAIRRTSDTFAPVPRIRPRRDGWTPERQTAFIDALGDTGSVTHAARAVGLTPESAYALRRADGAAEFAAAWDRAVARGVRRLHDATMERAIHGVSVPVFQGGRQVGERRVFNDRLAMFHLRHHGPGAAALRPPGARDETADGEGEGAGPRWPLTGQAFIDHHKREQEQAEEIAKELRDRLELFHIRWHEALERQGPEQVAAYERLFGPVGAPIPTDGLHHRLAELPPPLSWAFLRVIADKDVPAVVRTLKARAAQHIAACQAKDEGGAKTADRQGDPA